MTPVTPGWRIERRTLAHPDAAHLVERVQDEYAVLYGDPDSAPMEDDEFVGGRGAFLVGYLDETPVATAAWRWHAVPEGVRAGPAVELKRMYVVPELRRRGLARAMLAAVEADARAAGAAASVLETGLRQPEAIALYLSEGYREVPGFGHYQWSPLARCYAKEFV
ncbi:GNAT family N-acetyltransferase [Nocardioides sp. Y6]|uniref:GNAT family N-acetyltransferase n=1 Tax=Nocardioides malaquae TaxID=2773426 RepID=A0ABR9RUV8_9ACTN|nr:GNAT family N-acetyltransferase [Nocardioides malaquae]MBE7325375.1 GNAT family N-acetyltransferase [Nocardioides malaquae]